ncbi:MAG: 3-phosphoshikimate 1-carboxyvinyltransferase [bacterium]
MIELKPDKALVRGLSKEITAKLEVPGDKSISHRVVMLGSLANGKSAVSNLSLSRDNMATVAAFRKLGVNIKKQNLTGGGKDFLINGKGLYGLKEPESVINTANSGTLTRLLAGILAGSDFFSVMSGDKYLNSRPMKRIMEPLSLMGARITGRRGGNYPPVAISGGKLKSIYYEIPVPSAQVKSCIMLAGLFAEGNTIIYEKKATRDHTENLLRLQEYPVNVETPVGGGSLITVKGSGSGGGLKPFDMEVPGDFSSAAFFIALGILHKGSEITIKNVLLNEKRVGLLKVLEMMGADINMAVTGEVPEKAGDIKVKYSRLKGVAVPAEFVSDMIDEFPILSVIASFAEGKTTVTGAKELRVKESDRIKTIVFNLKRIGVEIKESEDGFEIKGNPDLNKSKADIAVLNSFGDHRIAMSMIIAGLILKNRKIELRDIRCINTSFPEFFDTVSGLINQ